MMGTAWGCGWDMPTPGVRAQGAEATWPRDVGATAAELSPTRSPGGHRRVWENLPSISQPSRTHGVCRAAAPPTAGDTGWGHACPLLSPV